MNTAYDEDGSYPRPQLVRTRWLSLDGPWEFLVDDDRTGEAERLFDVAAGEFTRTIEVPFPPESAASGIHDTQFHPVVWYRRVLGADDLLAQSAPDDRVLLHFGAVDHHARVYFDGAFVGEHTGGQTPFTVDVTKLAGARVEHVLVVRAEDDPLDAALPRGKQDWRAQPHGIWYHRTTGIWQSVWTETVPALRLLDVEWTPEITNASVRCGLTLSARPAGPISVEVTLTLDDDEVAHQSMRIESPRAEMTIQIPAMRNGQDRNRFLWSPEHPTLIGARITVRGAATGEVIDEVASYLGMRAAEVGGGAFLLNGHPYHLRAVLDQGYRADTLLANRGSAALRDEVDLIKKMGFNTVRIHQKAEDPRFLYWADRLGLLVWGETANAYEFSVRAVELLTQEWLALVRRDRSHPCIVAWVPINESWGIQDVAHDPRQQAYSSALANLTRALDPSRPVVSNEGWEHLDSDILGVHDYSSDVGELISRYGNRDAIATLLQSPGPAGRTLVLTAAQRARFDTGDAPLMVTEFGGISYAGQDRTWGYSLVHSDGEYAELLTSIFQALRSCPNVAGVCYTQLMDTEQETNGLVTENGKPKLPLETIHQIVTGQTTPPPGPTSTVG